MTTMQTALKQKAAKENCIVRALGTAIGWQRQGKFGSCMFKIQLYFINQ